MDDEREQLREQLRAADEMVRDRTFVILTLMFARVARSPEIGLSDVQQVQLRALFARHLRETIGDP